MKRLISLNHQREKVLLVYFGQIVIRKENNCPPVAPIGLFFIDGYLKKLGYLTKILHVITANNNEIMIESEQYKNYFKKEVVKFNPDYIGFSFRNILGIEVNPTLHTNLVEKSQNLISICNVYLEKNILNLYVRLPLCLLLEKVRVFRLPRYYICSTWA